MDEALETVITTYLATFADTIMDVLPVAAVAGAGFLVIRLVVNWSVSYFHKFGKGK